MRYEDILIDGIVTNVRCSDLIFKNILEDLVSVDSRTGNLDGVTSLSGALDILDNFTGTGTGTGTDTAALDRTISNINNNTVMLETVGTIINFNHGLNTEFFKYSIWVLEENGWQNSIVPITIIDNNTVRVELYEDKSIRIILEKIEDITKTYGL
jgi:hypothetical protein